MINKENDKLYIPKSIKDFSEAELTNLAKKIRKFMIAKILPQEGILVQFGHSGAHHSITQGIQVTSRTVSI